MFSCNVRFNAVIYYVFFSSAAEVSEESQELLQQAMQQVNFEL